MNFSTLSIVTFLVAPVAPAAPALAAVDSHTLFQVPGGASCRAGDVDGDGVPDVLIGKWGPHFATLRSGADGSTLLSFSGSGPAVQWAVGGAGDVDGDGVPDLLMGAHEADGPGTDAGIAMIASGTDGSILHVWHGDAADDHFGVSVAGIGDMNADGVPDVAVGACSPTYPIEPQNYARIFSGQDGAPLKTLLGSAIEGDRFGIAVASTADVDGDGHDDVLIGVPMDTPQGSPFWAGSARIYSGTTGKVLRLYRGDSTMDFLGYSVASAGDVDGDGILDAIAGAWGDDDHGDVCGSARVFAGASGATLFTVFGDAAFDRLGVGVGAAGDVNGDGRDDFVAGIPYESTGPDDSGAARVFSGVDGSPLHTWFGSVQFQNFGWSVAGLGDLNGDGRADLAVDSLFPGKTFVFSGAPLALAGDLPELSLSSGGTQSLALDAGAANAGRTYLVLGSVSGSAPGIPLGPHTLPLNFDAWTLFTLQNPNAPPFSNSLGVLDAAGQGAAAFTVPFGSPPAFAGVSFRHAFVVLGPGGAVAFASNAVPLQLSP